MNLGPDTGEVYVTDTGIVLRNVHARGRCLGEWCTIHRHSPHAKAIGRRQHWEPGAGMYRICAHGFLHPDPDDQPWPPTAERMAWWEAKHSVHLMDEHCDGCCQEPYGVPSVGA